MTSTFDKEVMFVTTFNETGYVIYGKQFLLDWVSMSDFPIAVYLEDMSESMLPPEVTACENVHVRYLDQNALQQVDNAELCTLGARGFTSGKPPSYILSAAKFFRKVLAAKQELDNGPYDWLVWIDSDVEFDAPLSVTALDDILNGAENCAVAYLGRKNWFHSETGFVAYNLNAGGKDIIVRMSGSYTTGAVFVLPQWHDAYVFDHIRTSCKADGYDLSEGKDLGPVAERGNDALHIWPHTKLGKYMRHNKGGLKMAKRSVA